MGTSDSRAQQAREHHLASLGSVAQAQQHREMRDAAIRQLRREDPAYWTYTRLAFTVGCSEQLIAYIVQERKLRQ